MAKVVFSHTHQVPFLSRTRLIHQYSNIVSRLSVQTSIFGVVLLVSESVLGIERQKKIYAILTRKPRSHVGILLYHMAYYKYLNL